MLSLHFKEGGTERENAAWKQTEKIYDKATN